MVSLRNDDRGNFIARKRLPDDVREEYGTLYGARHEAKFFARASLGAYEAKQQFRAWEAEVERNIETIRRTIRGEGIDLDHKQAHALAGDWYNWFIAQHDNDPGKPEAWDLAFWHLVDKVAEALPVDVQGDELERNKHLLTEWTAYPEVRTALRPIISDFGRTAQFLSFKGTVLSNAGRELFLNAALRYLPAALTLLERRAKGDYERDDLPDTFPQFAPRGHAKVTGPTPRELFDDWVKTRQPAHSTVESWQTVFNTLTRDFPDRSAESISHDEAQAWLDKLITKDRSAFTVGNTWLRATRRVYTWAVRRRKLSSNPFADAVVERQPRKKHRPKSFYEHEWRTILKAASAISDVSNPDEAAKRWVPWLLAYTGARPAEITQLRASDVEQVENVWTINLTPEAGSIKGSTARRVPLHSHLIDQGFLEFKKSNGEGPLFYRPRKRAEFSGDPLKGRKSPAAQARQRLAKWVREIGVDAEHLSPNHAWRHTFKLIGRRVEPDGTILDYICGHAPATVGREYGAPMLQDMARVIEKFPRYDTSENLGALAGTS